jgi:endonuclease III
MHGDTVRKNFEYTDNPGLHYPYVMDALIVATLSQATSWANAQRAMKSMTAVYGSAFAYQKILDGGEEKLRDALRPGGMQNRKAKMVMQILLDVRARHGDWDLNHLFNATDDDAVKELISYKGVGPKSALCILSICLQRDSFAVDTHIYRISGLWGCRPEKASREKAQAHLDARIPNDIKFALHYLLIVHGRECEVCRGNGNPKGKCEYKRRYKEEEASS